MKYIRLTMVDCETMKYQLINNADHTDTILLEGTFNCLNTNLSVLSLFNFLGDISTIELNTTDDLIEISTNEGVNEALLVIRDNILNLYYGLARFDE